MIQREPRAAASPNPRKAKYAAERRRREAVRNRYGGLMRFCGVLAIVVTFVMLYVMLIAHLTGLSYALGRAQERRTALEMQTARLDDRIAALQSDDRLARIAASLHMREPEQIDVVFLPARRHPAPQNHLAFLSTLTALLRVK